MSIVLERKGFHFTPTALTTSSGEPLFLVVKMKGRSTVEAPRLPVWEYSEENYVSFIQSNQIKSALVILDDFSFLSKCPSIEMLTLIPSNQAPNHISFDPVYSLPSLKMLQPKTIYGERDKYWSEFDCSKLLSSSQIEWFGADCKRGIKNMAVFSGLKSLLLSSYKASNLRDAIGSSSLDTLSLMCCGVNSLDGTQLSKKLQVVKLQTCSKLENIDALYGNRETLRGLVIDNCNKIRDYSVLSELKQLTRLSLCGRGAIPTLSFVEQLPNLKTLMLSVDVEDGDLSFCDRLEHVSIFPDRRHLNRKDEDLPKKKQQFIVWGDENIDAWRQHVMR